LHSLIRSVLRFFKLPILVGKASSSLHLSKHNVSRLLKFPRLSGSCFSTLFPEPWCPPMESVRRLEEKEGHEDEKTKTKASHHTEFTHFIRLPMEHGRTEISEASIKLRVCRLVKLPMLSGSVCNCSHLTRDNACRFFKSQIEGCNSWI
jgi:hypothetical protein